MSHPFVSIAEARRAIRDAATFLLWIDERQCKLFDEPGWEELQPHLDGAVLFLNRKRERAAPA
jgi:hypothetical protein